VVNVGTQKGGGTASSQRSSVNVLGVNAEGCVTDRLEALSEGVPDESRCNHTRRVVFEIFAKWCLSRLPECDQVLNSTNNGVTWARERISTTSMGDDFSLDSVLLGSEREGHSCDAGKVCR
jgi:hypothetical protein